MIREIFIHFVSAILLRIVFDLYLFSTQYKLGLHIHRLHIPTAGSPSPFSMYIHGTPHLNKEIEGKMTNIVTFVNA